MEQRPDPVMEIMNLEAEDVRRQFQKRCAFWTALTEDLANDLNLSRWECSSFDVPTPTLTRMIEASLLSCVNPIKRHFRVRAIPDAVAMQ